MEGLKPQNRLYVHLLQGYEMATKVGKCHETPIVLKIDTKRMIAVGKKFYLSENGVWLTKAMGTEFIEFK